MSAEKNTRAVKSGLISFKAEAVACGLKELRPRAGAFRGDDVRTLDLTPEAVKSFWGAKPQWNQRTRLRRCAHAVGLTMGSFIAWLRVRLPDEHDALLVEVAELCGVEAQEQALASSTIAEASLKWPSIPFVVFKHLAEWRGFDAGAARSRTVLTRSTWERVEHILFVDRCYVAAVNDNLLGRLNQKRLDAAFSKRGWVERLKAREVRDVWDHEVCSAMRMLIHREDLTIEDVAKAHGFDVLSLKAWCSNRRLDDKAITAARYIFSLWREGKEVREIAQITEDLELNIYRVLACWMPNPKDRK